MTSSALPAAGTRLTPVTSPSSGERRDAVAAPSSTERRGRDASERYGHGVSSSCGRRSERVSLALGAEIIDDEDHVALAGSARPATGPADRPTCRLYRLPVDPSRARHATLRSRCAMIDSRWPPGRDPASSGPAVAMSSSEAKGSRGAAGVGEVSRASESLAPAGHRLVDAAGARSPAVGAAGAAATVGSGRRRRASAVAAGRTRRSGAAPRRRRARQNRRIITGLGLRRGGLDEGAHLELGLQHGRWCRPAPWPWWRSADGETDVDRHDDPLQVPRCRSGTGRSGRSAPSPTCCSCTCRTAPGPARPAAAPRPTGHAADLGPGGDVVEQVGRPRSAPAPAGAGPSSVAAVGLDPLAEILDRAARELPLGAVGRGFDRWSVSCMRGDPVLRGPEALMPDQVEHRRRTSRCSPAWPRAGSSASEHRLRGLSVVPWVTSPPIPPTGTVWTRARAGGLEYVAVRTNAVTARPLLDHRLGRDRPSRSLSQGESSSWRMNRV